MATRTYSQAIDSLLAAVKTRASGESYIALTYRHSALGQDLMDAGHVTASREYAVGIDPFKLPREIRDAALENMGWAMDDNAAFPRARIAMVPVGRTESQYLVDNREEIMRAYAEEHL